MIRTTLLIMAILVGSSMTQAQGGRRKALIIGNARYTEFASLEPTTINDANAIATVLETIGFDKQNITKLYNLNHDEFLSAVAAFGASLKDDDSALFYFSGHGFSLGAENYLVPIGYSFGATITESTSAALSLTKILDHLQAANTRVVILDACRDEPGILKHLPKDASTQQTVEPLVGQQSYGTFIAYATASGQAAEARPTNGMSLYTNYLVASLHEGFADLQDALFNTRSVVYEASGKTQNPAIYANLQGSFPIIGARRKPINNSNSLANSGPPAVPATQITEYRPQERLALDFGASQKILLLVNEQEGVRADLLVRFTDQHGNNRDTDNEAAIRGFADASFDQRLKEGLNRLGGDLGGRGTAFMTPTMSDWPGQATCTTFGPTYAMDSLSAQERLAAAYDTCFSLGTMTSPSSVAFPAYGGANYPVDLAAPVALEHLVLDFQRAARVKQLKIVVKKEDFGPYSEALAKVLKLQLNK
jgi:O-acetyl-ADP-ribose deacetylase (regulator of RNase III)